MKGGTLYVVATPIGNLEDVTVRAKRILGSVTLVAAEDTRAAQHLLGHLGISVRVISYFEGNEARRSEELVAQLALGQDIALISEAGLPSVSDPGQRLVAAARAAAIAVVVLPGPNAALTALVGSGLPTERFYFCGFLPRQSGPRREQLSQLRTLDATLLFYEAPGRVGETLADLVAVFGENRQVCLARELTKIYEEYVNGTLGELAQRYAPEPPRGEVTLVVAGSTETRAAEIDVEAEVDRRLVSGDSAKEIAAALALLTGLPRRQIYQLALARRPR